MKIEVYNLAALRPGNKEVKMSGLSADNKDT